MNFRKFWFRYSRVIIGGIMFSILVIFALFAPYIATHEPTAMSMSEALTPPSAAHWCGTDEFGRDVFSRIVYGARVSLALVILTVLGSGIPNLVLALVITQLPRIVRTVRTTVISTKELEHVEAARAMGASDLRIMVQYIFPLCISPLIIRLTLTMALTVLNEASLTFLGVGLPPDVSSWGVILSEARQFITTSPYLIYLPGLAIVWSGLSLNLLGDGLRDALDPKLNSGR